MAFGPAGSSAALARSRHGAGAEKDRRINRLAGNIDR